MWDPLASIGGCQKASGESEGDMRLCYMGKGKPDSDLPNAKWLGSGACKVNS